MPFYCLRCGECCSAMGDVHALEGDPAAGRCVVVNRYTGERTPVAVDLDKIDLLAPPPVPGACPLFRRDADGRWASHGYTVAGPRHAASRVPAVPRPRRREDACDLKLLEEP